MRLFFVVVSVLVVSPAVAEDVYCDMWSDLAAESPAPSLWKVKAGSGHLLFQTNSGEGYSCPSDDPKCSAKAYLIDGDPVVVTSEAGDFACATFTNEGKENVSTGGWLPKASLEPVTLQTVSTEDFVGKWGYFDEQSIEITAAKDGTLTITGDASWGMHDPERVENGGVNTGQISAELKPERNFAAWTNAGPDGEAGPWQPGDADYNCSVRMWALPPFLVVSDNGFCGGNNVTFTGVYALAD